MSAHAATAHLHNVTSCHIGLHAKLFHGASSHYLSASPLHLFVSVDASRIIWEFEFCNSVEVLIQTATYLPFAEHK